VRQLKNKDAEICRWFEEDPRRLETFSKDPKSVIAELQRAIRWEGPPLEPAKIKGWELKPQLAPPPPAGGRLLLSTWQFITQDPGNAARFQAERYVVIQEVAAANNYPKEELDAVTRVFRRLDGIVLFDFDPVQTFHASSLAENGRQAIVARLT